MPGSYTLAYSAGAYAGSTANAAVQAATGFWGCRKISGATLLSAIGTAQSGYFMAVGPADRSDLKFQAELSNPDGANLQIRMWEPNDGYITRTLISRASIDGAKHYLIYCHVDSSRATASQWRIAIAEYGGAVLATIDGGFPTGALPTTAGYGCVFINSGNNGGFSLSRAFEDDGAAYGAGSLAAVPTTTPALASCLGSISYSDGSGATITNDVGGAPNFTLVGSVTWNAGGVWDSPVIPVDHVDVTGAASLAHFAHTTYTGTPKDAGGSPIGGYPITYRSTNTAVLTIDRVTGVAYALTAGSASVIATASGIDSAPYVVTVTAIRHLVWHGIASDAGYIATPELPRVCYDTSWHPHTGTVWNCTGGSIPGSTVASLATAFASAVGGDAIVLPDNYPDVLPPIAARSDTSYLHIRSLAIHNGTFPCPPSSYSSFTSPVNPASRVRPANSAACAQVGGTGAGVAVVSFNPGAGYVRFEGIRVQIDETVANSAPGLIWIADQGVTSNLYATMPHHIIFDRCLVRGSSTLTVDTKRGVRMEGRYIALIDCWIDQIHNQNEEAQAVAGVNCPGPFKVVNCFLSGSSMSYITGGADPQTPFLIPSDLEFRKNHSWKDPDWWNVSTTIWIKNHIEHKHGRRSLFEDVIVENNVYGVQGQTGMAFLFQPLTDKNFAPWTSITDLTFRRIQIKNCTTGFLLPAYVAYPDSTGPLIPNQPLSRVQMRDILALNLGENSTRTSSADAGSFLQLNQGINDLDVQHVTATNGGHMRFSMLLEPISGSVTRGAKLKNLLLAKGNFPSIAIFGDGGAGNDGAALDAIMGDYEWKKNTIWGVGGDRITAANFPGGSAQTKDVADEASMLFNLDYSLQAGSPAKGFSDDGTDPGCDIAALTAGIAGVAN